MLLLARNEAHLQAQGLYDPSRRKSPMFVGADNQPSYAFKIRGCPTIIGIADNLVRIAQCAAVYWAVLMPTVYPSTALELNDEQHMFAVTALRDEDIGRAASTEDAEPLLTHPELEVGGICGDFAEFPGVSVRGRHQNLR